MWPFDDLLEGFFEDLAEMSNSGSDAEDDQPMTQNELTRGRG